MSSTTTYTINVAGNATEGLNAISSTAAAAAKSTTSLQSAVQKVGMAAFAANNIKSAIDSVSTSLDSAIEPGVKLNSSMADLSAITGVTGDKLKEIEGYARESAKTFGGSAAKGVEAYKLILSQLGPDIAKTPAALKAMGEAVNTLSKTMGGDTTGATEVLTTAMNQFQVSLDDPTVAAAEMAKMMNVMAAAAKEGSAELPAIKAALENSGMAAKMAGVSFEELNAAIQVMDKAGKKGAEGGVAIRNVLATLSEGRFLPPETQKALAKAGVDLKNLGNTSLSFRDRLNLLKPAMGDAALITKLFGKENQNAALALISGTDEIGRYTTVIAGTKSAQEQAGIVMGSFSEKMGRVKAITEDWGISLFNMTKGALPAFKIGVMAIQGVVGLVTLASMSAAIAEGVAAAATGVWTAAQWLLNAAFIASPIGWIVLGVGLLVAGVVIAWNKFEGFRNVVMSVWEVMKGFGGILKDFVLDRIKGIISGIGSLGSAIYKLFTGDFKGAWKDAKQGALDLSGVSAVTKAATAAKQVVTTAFAPSVTKSAESRNATAEKTTSPAPVRQQYIPEVIKKTPAAKESVDNSSLDKTVKAAISFPAIQFINTPTESKNKSQTTAIADAAKQPSAVKTNEPISAASKNATTPGAAIQTPLLPGAKTNKSQEAPGSSKKTSDTVVTGGTKSTNITITLKELVGEVNINANGTLKEPLDKMAQMVLDKLTRVLSLAQASA